MLNNFPYENTGFEVNIDMFRFIIGNVDYNTVTLIANKVSSIDEEELASLAGIKQFYEYLKNRNIKFDLRFNRNFTYNIGIVNSILSRLYFTFVKLYLRRNK